MTSQSASDQPSISRPHIPGYGIPETEEGTLPWSYVGERLKESPAYWVCTVDAQNRPHAIPIWGAWVDGVLYLEVGSPDTAKVRNMKRNPNVSVHLDDSTRVVTIMGEVREVIPDAELGQKLSDEMRRKYAPGYEPGPDSWNQGGMWALIPRIAFAWTTFPGDATRYRFE